MSVCLRSESTRNEHLVPKFEFEKRKEKRKTTLIVLIVQVFESYCYHYLHHIRTAGYTAACSPRALYTGAGCLWAIVSDSLLRPGSSPSASTAVADIESSHRNFEFCLRSNVYNTEYIFFITKVQSQSKTIKQIVRTEICTSYQYP